MLRVLLIEDHELYREGLKRLLQPLDTDVSVSEASTLLAAIERKYDPFDLILLDLHLPDSRNKEWEAVDAVRAAYPETPLVVVSAVEEPELVVEVYRHGASGYIPKSSTGIVMKMALELVLAGEKYLPSLLLAPLIEAPAPAHDEVAFGDAGRESSLTERQREVLQLAGLGMPNKLIARELKLSEGTVKAHLSSAFKVLGATNRTQAREKAAQLDIWRRK